MSQSEIKWTNQDYKVEALEDLNFGDWFKMNNNTPEVFMKTDGVADEPGVYACIPLNGSITHIDEDAEVVPLDAVLEVSYEK